MQPNNVSVSAMMNVNTSTDATCAVNNYSDKTMNLSDNATIRYHNVMTQEKVPDTDKNSQDIVGRLKVVHR